MNRQQGKKHYKLDGIELFIYLDKERNRKRWCAVAESHLERRHGIVDQPLAAIIVDDFLEARRTPEKGARFKERYNATINNVLKWRLA